MRQLRRRKPVGVILVIRNQVEFELSLVLPGIVGVHHQGLIGLFLCRLLLAVGAEEVTVTVRT